MIENNHFLTRTLLVFPLLRLFLQQELTFTPLRYFPPTKGAANAVLALLPH